jgi:3D (Asp-Asp-Asp) domain-containing protein
MRRPQHRFYESQTTQDAAAWCYGPRLVRTGSRTTAARLAAAFGGALLAASVPAATGADSAGLRAQSSSLEARADSATLELYAIETELARVRAERDALEAQRQELIRERATARAQLVVARRVVRVSQAQLEELARTLYEQPSHDPLAVVLGADSLEEALAGLDGLDRAAGQSNRILEQARDARARLEAADAELKARGARLAEATAAVEARAASLAATAASRRAFVAGLRRQQELNAARIVAIEADARAAEQRTTAIAAATSPAEPVATEVATPLVTATGERTLTVGTTGYAIKGHTATGIPTSPGVVAVDPSVIPLGTRMTIPGYGTGIAADTGGAVQGAKIDLWFPTTAQALAWGHRTVTITIH